MCTLVARIPSSPGEPLVVAANRDEWLARPARPPFVWPGPPRFAAPRDEEAGGTWLGVSERGLFVGVTNRAGEPRDPKRRSRGELVTRALTAPSASALHAELAGLDPAEHNAFHLLYAARDGAFITFAEGGRLVQRALAPGLAIVTERSPHGDDTPRAKLIRRRFAEAIEPRLAAGGTAATPGVLDALGALLALHDDDDPIAGTCVHADALGYGTRSSLVLWLDPAARGSAMRWAEGKPCRVPFEDRTALLAELGLAASPSR
jgi:uncharacterized protein with NRDE domain